MKNVTGWTMEDVKVFENREDQLRRFQRDDTYEVLSRFEKRRIINLILDLRSRIRFIQDMVVFTGSTWTENGTTYRLGLTNNNSLIVQRINGDEFEFIPSGWNMESCVGCSTFIIDGGTNWVVNPPHGICKEIESVYESRKRDAIYQNIMENPFLK